MKGTEENHARSKLITKVVENHAKLSNSAEVLGYDTSLPLPPKGHPLHTLGARLANLLDEDDWNNIEPLLIDAWNSFRKGAS